VELRDGRKGGLLAIFSKTRWKREEGSWVLPLGFLMAEPNTIPGEESLIAPLELRELRGVFV
jgi:hypothetical protein